MFIHLRKLRKTDAKAMLEWIRDPETTVFLDGDFEAIGLEECEKFIFASAFTISRRDFAVADENDDYIGFAALKNIDDDEKNAEISIVINKNFRRMGAAEEALRQLIRIGFYGLHLNMLYSYTKIGNERAAALFEKLFFRKMPTDGNSRIEYRLFSENRGN